MESELAGCCSTTHVPKHGSAQGVTEGRNAILEGVTVRNGHTCPWTDRRMQEGGLNSSLLPISEVM